MATTFELIQAYTVGAGGQSSITFNTIPGTYTDLCLKISGRTTYTGNVFDGNEVVINGSSASLSSRTLYGLGSGSGATNTDKKISGSENSGGVSTANTFGNSEIYFPNYAGSTYKSFSADGASENNATTAAIVMAASLQSSTSAITSIAIYPESGTNFAQHSTAYLYGVKNA